MLDKVIIKNISSLFSIQLANYIVPLITLPYLVRVLGIEGYGYLGFSLSIAQYAILFVNYGFDLSATSAVAKSHTDKNKISEIFWSVLCIRIVALLVSILFILLISFTIEIVANTLSILTAAMVLVLASALFPQWLFQGKEKLGAVSIARVTAQVLSVPILFIFVDNEADVWLAALITSLPSLLVSIYSLYLVYKWGWVSFKKPCVEEIKSQLIDGWHMFISTAAVGLYTTTVPIILGFISGATSVGYFISAQRIIYAILGVYSTFSNAFYPRVNSVVEKSRDEARNLIFKLGKFTISIAIICFIFVFVFADFIIKTLFGSGYEITAEILRILSILPVIISISNLMGVQVLVPFGYKKEFAKVLLFSSSISLLILIPAIFIYSEYGAAICVVTTELLVTTLMLYTVFKLKILRVQNEI